VTLVGAGNAEVHATGFPDDVVSGSGCITYTGNPTVSPRVDGSGDASQRQ
jgi:hypothetical protein